MEKTMKQQRCGLKHLLAGIIAIALLCSACAPAQSVALAETPETTKVTLAPTQTLLQETAPVLSREEEIAALGFEDADEQDHDFSFYVFAFCVLQNGEKVVIPGWMSESSRGINDFRYIFGHKVMITFFYSGLYESLFENRTVVNKTLKIATHTVSIPNLDGANIEYISDLFEFPETCKKFGIDIIESEEYQRLFEYLVEDGMTYYTEKAVNAKDFVNFYISSLKKENRIDADFVNSTVRTRGVLALGQTPYITPEPTPLPTPEAEKPFEEEAKLLGADYSGFDEIEISRYFAAIFTDQSGNKKIAWQYVSSPDMQTHYFVNAISYGDLFTFTGDYYGKSPSIDTYKEGEIVFSDALSGFELLDVEPLYELLALYIRNDIGFPDTTESKEFFAFLRSKGPSGYADLQMSYTDFVKAYIAVTPKEYRLYSANLD